VDLVYVSGLQDVGTHGGQVDPLRGGFHQHVKILSGGDRTLVMLLLGSGGCRTPFLPERQRLDHPVGCGIEPRASSKMVLPMTLPTTGLTLRSSDGVGIFRRASHPARLLGVAAAAFAVLVATGIALRPGQDLGLARALNGLHTGALAVVTSATYNVFEPVPSVVLTAALAAVIWIVKDLRTGAAFAGVVALTWIPSEMIKLIVRRGRPDVLLMPYPFLPVQTDASFPSGHTAFIVALVVALAFVVQGTRWHPIVVGVGTSLIVLVALALAVDAVHYPTDIAASRTHYLAANTTADPQDDAPATTTKLSPRTWCTTGPRC